MHYKDGAWTKQAGGKDCGIFAVSNGTSVAYGMDLIACLTQKTMTLFRSNDYTVKKRLWLGVDMEQLKLH